MKKSLFLSQPLGILAILGLGNSFLTLMIRLRTAAGPLSPTRHNALFDNSPKCFLKSAGISFPRLARGRRLGWPWFMREEEAGSGRNAGAGSRRVRSIQYGERSTEYKVRSTEHGVCGGADAARTSILDRRARWGGGSEFWRIPSPLEGRGVRLWRRRNSHEFRYGRRSVRVAKFRIACLSRAAS